MSGRNSLQDGVNTKINPLYTNITLYDGSDNPAEVDDSTHTLQTITYEHHEIHSGSHYYIEDVQALSLNNVLDVQFTTTDTTKWAHFLFLINCESEIEWYIYEGATINTAGATLTPHNNNRNSANTSDMTIANILNSNISNANADTPIAGALEIAHGAVGSGKDSGIIGRDKEIILKQNTTYCMRAIAIKDGYVNFLMEWYEYTNK